MNIGWSLFGYFYNIKRMFMFVIIWWLTDRNRLRGQRSDCVDDFYGEFNSNNFNISFREITAINLNIK